MFVWCVCVCGIGGYAVDAVVHLCTFWGVRICVCSIYLSIYLSKARNDDFKEDEPEMDGGTRGTHMGTHLARTRTRTVGGHGVLILYSSS